MDVGIRELKARLSEYVSRAARGERVVVTDRGTPVAELTGLTSSRAFDRGVSEGWIEPARRGSLEPVERVPADEAILDVLGDDRL